MLLIDGDILIFRIGFVCHKLPDTVIKKSMDNQITSIIDTLGYGEGHIYLTGSGNFRRRLTPSYKAHRAGIEIPPSVTLLRHHLIDMYDAYTCKGYEADDALGIMQGYYRERGEESIIISTDKDLDQIPGWHYNPWKPPKYHVDEPDACMFLYTQLLTGDVADNIKGIKGIGPVKAAKLLGPHKHSPAMMYKTVQEQYERVYGEQWKEQLDLNIKLLRIISSPQMAQDYENIIGHLVTPEDLLT